MAGVTHKEDKKKSKKPTNPLAAAMGGKLGGTTKDKDEPEV